MGDGLAPAAAHPQVDGEFVEAGRDGTELLEPYVRWAQALAALEAAK